MKGMVSITRFSNSQCLISKVNIWNTFFAGAQFRRNRSTEATVGEEFVGEDEVAGAPRHHYPELRSIEFQREEKAWQVGKFCPSSL